MRMRLIFLLCCSLFSMVLCAQTIETNAEGERIVRFQDGSWRYYEPADSVYMAKDKDTTVTTTEKNISPVLEAKITSSRQQIQKVEKEIINLMERRVAINEKLLKVEDTKEKLDLNTELQRVIHQEKEQKRIYLDLQKELEDLKAISSTSPEKQRTFLDGTAERQIEDGKIKYDEGREIQSIPDHIYEIPFVCEVQKDVDDFSKLTKTFVANSILFEYTPKVIRSHINKKAFVTAYVSAFHIQGRFYFNVMIDVASEKARQTYGYISQGGQLILQLVNGDVYSLNSTGNSIGTIMPSGKFTRYDVAYAVDYKIINELKKHPLDKVRLVWSTGYEDYPVYNVDVLKDQVICLESNL